MAPNHNHSQRADTRHFTVGVFAQPRSQFDGSHEDEEETQGEGKGDQRYGAGRGHRFALAGL